MRSTRQNAASNFIAGLLPAIVLLATTPIIVRGLGADQYGLLVIASSLAGYMGVLDVNVTAGTVKFMAGAAARGAKDEVDRIFSFGLATYLAIGVLGTLLILVFAEELAHWFVSRGSVEEGLALQVFTLTAGAFFFGQIYSYLLSVPQALRRYDVSSRVEVVMGAIGPLTSALAVLVGAGLMGVMWVRIAAALVAAGLLLWAVVRLMHGLRLRWPQADLRRQLLGFSAFAYLSRLASLSYQHGDKLVVVAMLDAKAVAFYAIPVMLANRIFGTTYRITQVIFPAASALLEVGQSDRVTSLLLRSTRLVFAINAGAVVTLALVGGAFLRVWVGSEFASQGALVLILIACGALADSLTNAPSLVTDGSGQARVTGIGSVIRACVGLGGISVGAWLGGIQGVAAAHLVVSLVFAILFIWYFSRQVFALSLREWAIRAVWPGLRLAAVGLATGFAVVWALPGPWLSSVIGAAAAAGVMALMAWHHVFDEDDRRLIRARWAKRVA